MSCRRLPWAAGEPAQRAGGRLTEGGDVPRFMRLQLLLRKSVEYKILHADLNDKVNLKLKLINYCIIFLSTLVTVNLLVFAGASWVNVFAGGTSSVIGILVSIIHFLRMEVVSEGHQHASQAFEALARDLITFFTTCTPEGLDPDTLGNMLEYASDAGISIRHVRATILGGKRLTAIIHALLHATRAAHLCTHPAPFNATPDAELPDIIAGQGTRACRGG